MSRAEAEILGQPFSAPSDHTGFIGGKKKILRWYRKQLFWHFLPVCPESEKDSQDLEPSFCGFQNLASDNFGKK